MKKLRAYEQQAQVMRALAHPVRLRILDILQKDEECVCHLTAVLGAQQPYVSKQLAVLREADLVSDRRDGMMVYYRLQNGRTTEVMDAVRGILASQSKTAVAWPPVPAGPVPGCPCPKCEAGRNE
jgi:DNA-binding transcriptional ArsR family regulator